MTSRKQAFGLLALVAISTPAALGIETLLRYLMLPPEFEQIREWLRPTVTPWVWGCAGLAVVAGFAALPLQRFLRRRALAKAENEEMRGKMELDTLMLSTSVPQVPALLAVIGFMVGAELEAVVVALAAGTFGVLLQGFGLQHSS